MPLVSDGHALYQAAVGFMVASKSDADSWEHVARWVHAMNGTATREEMKAEFKLVEKQIKADFNVTIMPSAWRSAKATALKAAILGVMLVFDDKVVGKTEVSKNNKIAATKPTTQVPVDPEPFDIALNKELVALYHRWDGNKFKTNTFVTNLKHFLRAVEAHA